MKHDLRIIGYITFTIFILLWINQLFSGIKLYETVKTRWQIHMDSIIESVIPRTWKSCKRTPFKNEPIFSCH